MGWRIVRQPNGKLASFSDIIDDFTMYDATEEEAVSFCIDRQDMGPKAAAEKVKAGVEDHEPWKHGVKGNGLSRFDDSLKTVAGVHGIGRVREILKDMGCADYDVAHLELDRIVAEREADMLGP